MMLKDIKTSFDIKQLHKLSYTDRLILPEGSEYKIMPACIKSIDDRLIEVLIMIMDEEISEFICRDRNYVVLYKEKFSWRLNRLICSLI